jgi:hypothetical protein
MGIRIKNIGKTPLEKIKFKPLPLKSGDSNKGIIQSIDQHHLIDLINPNEEKIIWFGKTNFPVSGLTWLKIELESSKEITTYQWKSYNKAIEKMDKKNVWENCFNILDENYYQQQKTNTWLIVLSIIMAISSLTTILSLFLN